MEPGLFLELLQVSVGTRDELSRVPTVEAWEWLLKEAQRHAISGVLVSGIDRIPKAQQPPKKMRVQLAGQVLEIEKRNKVLTSKCGKLCNQLEADGFLCCVLKGQANLVYYPAGTGVRRIYGDIDIWAVPKEVEVKTKKDIMKTIEYVQEKFGLTGLCRLHTISDVSGIPVEVHFHPSFFNRPKYNKRLLHFFSDINACTERKVVDGTDIPAMRMEVDVVYQMSHIYRHMIDEGIGLRQVVDYFFLLKSFKERNEGVQAWEDVREMTTQVIGNLGMKRFSQALMYVLQEVLGMSQEYLLCEPSVSDGKFLMGEIMMSGNFGQGDPRMAAISSEGGYLYSRLCQAWRRFKRNLRFLFSYPGEVIWEPIVRVDHFMWKILQLWK